MADFSHLGIVNTEIRSNTPTTKAFDKEEPGIDQGSFPGQMAPTFAAVALPGMSGREVSFQSLLFAYLCRVALDTEVSALNILTFMLLSGTRCYASRASYVRTTCQNGTPCAPRPTLTDSITFCRIPHPSSPLPPPDSSSSSSSTFFFGRAQH